LERLPLRLGMLLLQTPQLRLQNLFMNRLFLGHSPFAAHRLQHGSSLKQPDIAGGAV
uniref:Uncharacterized protein n=1 Tax=Parascaris univalens TaxID=6257 RepID=A0A915ABJ3_PARUN